MDSPISQTTHQGSTGDSESGKSASTRRAPWRCKPKEGAVSQSDECQQVSANPLTESVSAVKARVAAPDECSRPQSNESTTSELKPWRKSTQAANKKDESTFCTPEKSKRPWRKPEAASDVGSQSAGLKAAPWRKREGVVELQAEDGATSDVPTATPSSSKGSKSSDDESEMTEEEKASETETCDQSASWGNAQAGSVLTVEALLRWRTFAAVSGLGDNAVNWGLESGAESLAQTPKAGARDTKSCGYRKDRRTSGKPSERPRRGDHADDLHNEYAKLETSTNSWAARQSQRRAEAKSSDEKSDEEVVRALRSILNKLTVEKYDTLYKQMLDCGMSKVDHVELLVHEITEKATKQHHFIEMYTQLCVHLHEWFVENRISNDPKTSFKRILQNECQNSFARYLNPVDFSNIPEAEVHEAQTKCKLQMLGNIKFVGALLGKRMLASSVLISVAEELIVEPCSNEALESLAAFLTSVGGTFDRPDWQHHKRFSAVIETIGIKTKNKAVPARIRFLLQDVLDLQSTGWENMKKVTQKDAGPMKLGEIHDQAACEDVSVTNRSMQDPNGFVAAGKRRCTF